MAFLLVLNCEEIVEPNRKDVTAVGSSLVIIIIMLSVIMGLACFVIDMYKEKNQNRPRPVGFGNPVHLIENVDTSPVLTLRSYTPSIHNYEKVNLPPYEPDGGFHHEAGDQGNA